MVVQRNLAASVRPRAASHNNSFPFSFFELLVVPLCVAAAVISSANASPLPPACVAPTLTAGSTLSMTSCSVSAVNMVVNVSQLSLSNSTALSRSAVVSDIVLAGGNLIILGWNRTLAASSPGAANLDGDVGTLNVSLSGIVGVGRVIVLGDFPSGTSVALSSSSVTLNDSVALTPSVASLQWSSSSDYTYAHCAGAFGVGASICISTAVLGGSFRVGPAVTARATWDATASGSGYGGAVEAVAAISLFVRTILPLGTLTFVDVTASAATAATNSARASVGFVLVPADRSQGRVFGAVNISQCNIAAEAFGASTLAIGVYWHPSPLGTAAGMRDLSLSGGSAVVELLLTTVSATAAAQGLAVGWSMDTSSWGSVELRDGASLRLTQARFSISSADGSAVGAVFSHLLLEKECLLGVIGGEWHVTSNAGSATGVHMDEVVATFASVVWAYDAYFNITTASSNVSASWWFVNTSHWEIDSEFVLAGNTVEFNVNATQSEEVQPIGVRIDDTLDIGLRSLFVVANCTFDFRTALNPTLIDGAVIDNMIFLNESSTLKLLRIELFGGPGAKIFSRSEMKIGQFDPQQRTVVLGCFRINDVFPVYFYTDYMSADVIDIITAAIDCDCSNPFSVMGSAIRIHGTFPDCVIECQRGSLHPVAQLRQQCVGPTMFTPTATITTKTRPPMVTATTFTDFLSETRRSWTLTSTITPPPTPTSTGSRSQSDEDPSYSRSLPLTPSSTFSWSPSTTRFKETHSATHSTTFAASRSRSKTVALTMSLPTSSTRSASYTSVFTATVTEPEVSSSRQRTRWTYALSISRGTETPTVTRTLRLLPTLTYNRHSRTLTEVQPPPPFLFLEQSQALGFLTLALTIVSSFLSGNPTVFYTQFIAVVGQTHAASDNAFQRTLPMAYLLSPFWDLSKVVVAAGNLLIILGFLIGHAALMKLDVASRLCSIPGGNEEASGSTQRNAGDLDSGDGTSPPEESTPPQSKSSQGKTKPATPAAATPIPVAWPAHRYPRLSYAFALLWYQGTVSAAFSLFYHESGPAFVMGTICLLFTIALPMMVYWILFAFLRGRLPQYRAVQWTVQTARLLPGGFWQPSSVTAAFGALFESLSGPEKLRFVAYPNAVVLLVNAAAAAYAKTQSQRNAQFGLIGLVFLLAAVLIGVLRPHRHPVTNAVYTASFVLLLMLCVCLANESTNVGAANGVPVLIILLEILLWCHGVFEVVMWHAEQRGFISLALTQLRRTGTSDAVRFVGEAQQLHQQREAVVDRDDDGATNARDVGPLSAQTDANIELRLLSADRSSHANARREAPTVLAFNKPTSHVDADDDAVAEDSGFGSLLLGFDTLPKAQPTRMNPLGGEGVAPASRSAEVPRNASPPLPLSETHAPGTLASVSAATRGESAGTAAAPTSIEPHDSEASASTPWTAPSRQPMGSAIAPAAPAAPPPAAQDDDSFFTGLDAHASSTSGAEQPRPSFPFGPPGTVLAATPSLLDRGGGGAPPSLLSRPQQPLSTVVAAAGGSSVRKAVDPLKSSSVAIKSKPKTAAKKGAAAKHKKTASSSSSDPFSDDSDL